ncbi:pimeloyl-ACP methyl ester carboxylesterase [Arthrobacter pigmenti]|uniref:Pimeloyl-ACP methyl ester carboxylesterase n=1 Tax=Arthrobacter pigmenti TaxID=271432 RepID=A0A846RHS2_9MICC|nr:pimeloyl-ACP methyl ester carboxylesterase [Arthrobacter pigmenti]
MTYSQPKRRSTWRALAGAAAVVVGLVLSGCTAGPETGQTTAPQEAIGDVPDELREFYEQEVAWEECEGEFACATVEVPLDYSDPERESIEVAAIRMDASGDAQGSLLVNPGGPGGSGFNFVRDSAELVLSDRLRQSYDVIGFDPRGVNRSSAVECLTDEERDEARAETMPSDITDTEALAVLEAESAEYADLCAERTGELLGYVDTVSAAKDMDILRALVGDEQLNYLGFSYGTQLGAAYAELYPEKVGRFVLDGAVDPSLSASEITFGQVEAFHEALRNYVADCQTKNDCPLPGDVEEGVAVIDELFESLEQSPMTAADGRLVTVGTFFQGFVLPLYDSASWTALTVALDLALQGDPTEMLRFADLSAEREPDGDYLTNAGAAFTAVNCLDYPMPAEPEVLAEEAEALEAASSVFGEYLSYGALACEEWAYEPVLEPSPASAPGAAPMIVIGTTGDPATPYDWSLALADQLESAVHVTWEGQGHTAYGRSGQCIENIVDGYLIEGTLPEDGVRC